MQNYLTGEDLPSTKKILFKMRTRMARFGENYRGTSGPNICPLCQTHPDNQQTSFQCKEIRKKIEIKGKLEDIYTENINEDTIKTVVKIMEIRKSKLGY